jgi:cytochrome c-type biogenesis protein CcmF
MLALGQGALLVTLVAAAWSVLAALLGGVLDSRPLTRSAGRAIVATFVLLLIAMGSLQHAILTNNFAVEYVFDYSSRSQPLPYKVSALWAGQGGSLLFWALLLGLFGTVLVATRRRVPGALLPWAYATMGATTLFFALVARVASNPLRLIEGGVVPADGQGMNPLLQNFWMMIHPPTLYLGFVGCTVPFALTIGALVSGKLDAAWVRSMRSWALFTFAFLTLGIWLGGYWAYIELGWGGFWAWDAVENASLMPWLVLTAFVHSIIAQERRGVLKVWNVALIIATFLLCIYGTFLTRSGIIQSVHAFGKSSIGNWFIAFLVIAGAVSVGALLKRLPQLRPEAKIESLASRESSFLFGNLVFLGITIMVFMLTMWPVFSELLQGSQVTFKPEQFTAVTRPFFLLAVLLMGIGPLTGWRTVGGAGLLRGARVPAAIGVGSALLVALLGAREPWSLLSFAVSIFAASSVCVDFGRMVRARRDAAGEPLGRALLSTITGRRQRFGAYFSHLSVVLMVIGIAASMGYQQTQVFESMTPGQEVEVDGYRLTYLGYDLTDGPTFEGARVRIAVVRPGSGSTITVLPELRRYGLNRPAEMRQPSTEVAILSTLVPTSVAGLRRIGEDLYVIPHAVDLNGNTASVEVIIHPFVNGLWLGGVLLLIGTLIAYWPERRQAGTETATSPARAPLPGLS